MLSHPQSAVLYRRFFIGCQTVNDYVAVCGGVSLFFCGGKTYIRIDHPRPEYELKCKACRKKRQILANPRVTERNAQETLRLEKNLPRKPSAFFNPFAGFRTYTRLWSTYFSSNMTKLRVNMIIYYTINQHNYQGNSPSILCA